MTRARTILLGCVLLAACGGSAPPAAPVAARDPDGTAARAEAPARPLCRFEGALDYARLRTPETGTPYASVGQATAVATLTTDGARPRLDAEVQAGGWHLRGWLDPSEDPGLRTRDVVWLLDGGLVLPPGRGVRANTARPGEVRAFLSLDPEDGVRLLRGPVQRWIGCDAVALAGPRDRGRPSLRELGLPPDPTPLRLAAEGAVPLSLEPGGAPFAELLPAEHPRTVFVVETRDGQRRLLHRHPSGVRVIGWAPTEALTEAPEDAGGATRALLGVIGSSASHERCTSDAEVALAAETEGGREAVGRIEPGAPFRRVETRDDGRFVIRGLGDASLTVADGATLVGTASAPPSCETVESTASALGALAEDGQLPEAGGFGLAAASPAAELTVAATVAQSTHRRVSVGTACEARVTYRPGRRYECRATVRCGGLTLYGARPTNGFFPCTVEGTGDDDAEPTVAGRDEQTNDPSGDPALDLDTTERSLVVVDDRSGPHGAYRITARIGSVTER